MTSQTLNGAALTVAALKESDQEAFERLLRGMLKSGIDPTAFEHGPIEADPESAQHAVTDVKVARSKAHISLWAYRDTLPIRYRRIHLDAVKARFGNVIRADLPSTSRELMSIYFHENQLHDRSAAVVDEPVMQLGTIEIAMTEQQFLLYGASQFTVKPLQRQLQAVITTSVIPGFRSASDFDSDAVEHLMNQVIATNQASLPYPLEPDLLRWGQPAVKGGYAHDNTSIILTAEGDGYYLGDIELTYTRMDFGWATGGNQHYVEGPTTPTTAYMIQRVSALTGYPISLEDVVAEVYPAVPSGGLETLTIFFKPECLRYVGELTIDYRAV
jgi:hypothetical protein